MRSRGMALFLATALAVSAVTGCSGGGSTGKAAADVKGGTTAEVDPAMYDVTEPITIKWWHALEDQYSDLVKEIVDDFNNSQELITVEAEYIGNYTKLNEALVSAHAAGTDLPAITAANSPYVAEYGAGGLTEDLTPYIQAGGYDLTDFGDGMIAAASYDGKQVSLPFLISTQIMYYNKDMAEELGITIPEKWADMDAFMEKAAQFHDDGTTKVYGTVMPGWDQWYFETFYLNNGVKIINDDQVTTDLNGENALAVTDRIKEWCDKGYTYWTGTADDASSIMRQHFIDGEAFSVVHTSSLYTNYENQCDFEIGMAWLPGGDSTKNQEIGGSVLLIPSKNDQATKNAAWKFMQYLCSKEVNLTWARGTGYIPTRKSVLVSDEGKQFLEEKPAFKAIFDNLDLIQPRIQHKAWSQLANIWRNSMAQLMLEGGETKEAMSVMTDEINDVLGDS